MADLKLKLNISRSQKQLLSTFSGLFILCVAFTILSEYFFSVNNLLTVATQTAVIAIIAVGQTYVLITGGIDLSIGSNIALAAVITGFFLKLTPDPSVPTILLGIFLGLCVGALVGAISGALITFGKIPPFIATLGTMTVVRGVALTLTKGLPVSGLPRKFTVIGTGSTLGIPNPVIIMVALVFIFGFILAKTKLGRHIYSVGSNFEAARLSGVNTRKTIIFVYIFSGVLAAAAGLMVAARIISAHPAAGDGYELDALSAEPVPWAAKALWQAPS